MGRLHDQETAADPRDDAVAAREQPGVRLGAQGTISGLANVVPRVLAPIVATGEEDPRVVRMVEELLRFPVTPAVKALVAHHRRDARWLVARPPLVGLDRAGAEHMARAFDEIFAAQPA